MIIVYHMVYIARESERYISIETLKMAHQSRSALVDALAESLHEPSDGESRLNRIPITKKWLRY